LGDRLKRERALRLGYLAQAGTLAIAGLALWADAPLWLIYPIAALDAVAASVTRPIYLASLPGQVRGPQELASANSVSMMIEEAGMFAGPAIAAVLLIRGEPWTVYAIFACGQLLAAALIVAGDDPSPSPTTDRPAAQDRGSSSVLRAALAGLGELRRTGRASLMLGYLGAAWCVAGGLELLAVVLALDVLGTDESGPGLLLAAAGMGGVFGATVSAFIAGRRRLGPVIAGVMLLASVPLIPAGASPGLAVAGILFMLAATGRSLLDVAARTLLQQSVRVAVMARVFGLHEAMLLVAQAIGVLLVPMVVAGFGPRGAFVVFGSLLPLVLLLTWRSLQRLDASVVPAPALGLLGGTPIFRSLPPPELEQLARSMDRIQVEPGEVVIRQGQLGDRFYLIESGRVGVSVNGLPRPPRGPGEFFGEIALVRNLPRSASVTAEVPTVLYSLARAEFLAALTGSNAAREAAAAAADRRLARGPRSGRRYP
jgi:hypothetical protein